MRGGMEGRALSFLGGGVGRYPAGHRRAENTTFNTTKSNFKGQVGGGVDMLDGPGVEERGVGMYRF